MTVTRLRKGSAAERIAALEDRADGHDVMAGQVKEMYEVFDLTRKVFRGLNRASVKISALSLGLLGALATLLTIVEKGRQLLGH
jgi:hypothetical protein